MNRIFARSIRQSKGLPDFAGTDQFQVLLTLRGEVTDPRFVKFLEKVGEETLESFTTEDFLVLDLAHREQPIPPDLRSTVARLRDLGVVERLGHGRGTRYLLSRRFYEFLGQPGVCTRRRGLDREQNKELLVQHLREAGADGARMDELQQVLPALSREQIKHLLRTLRQEGRIQSEGERRGARWVICPFTVGGQSTEEAPE